ncbi:hypothetical protein AAE478_007893 [Parahypoxylon ruwenzoriense]
MQPLCVQGVAARAAYEDKKQPLSDLVRSRWFPLFGAGAAAVCVGFFTASLAYYWRTQPAEHWIPGQEPRTPTGRPSIQSPRDFDTHLDKSEWRFGITKLRRKIAAQARGHVLEVAVGAGRNFDYYDWEIVTKDLELAAESAKEKEGKSSWFSWGKDKGGGKGEEKEKEKKDDGKEQGKDQVKRRSYVELKAEQAKMETAVLSFTGLDISAPMLDLALTRIRQVVPYMADQVPKKPSFAKLASKPEGSEQHYEEGLSLAGNRIRILKADAQVPPLPAPPSTTSTTIPNSPPPQKYDTIIQTFGLCSVRDPVALLSAMGSALRPETGRIFLLEHGRSNWLDLVNGLLDRGARGHFERFGCWWNRDIELVVRAAERSVPGLEVLRVERPGWITFGTHVLIEMRVRDVSPPASAAAASATTKGGEKGQAYKEEEEDGKTTTTGGWWSSLLSVSKTGDKPKKDG